MFYNREAIAAKSPKHRETTNRRLSCKQKWLIGCSYNLKKTFTGQHIETLSKNIDLYSLNYENFAFRTFSIKVS